MSKAIKFKNNIYLDSKSVVHNRETLNDVLNKTKVDYVSSFGGMLIKLPNAGLYKMIMIKIIGNGYGGSPIDTIIQGYHYESIGYFINCKQHNNSGSLPMCKFMIVDGVIGLWIPTPGIYTSLVVEAYESIPTNSKLNISIALLGGEPEGSYKINCTVV